jgi:hypothetical protein
MATAHTLRRAVVAGGLALAALTVPAVIAMNGPGSTTTTATGQCLAWFGSRGDGQCIGYSNGNPTYIGTPQGGYLGPGYGNGLPGVSSGPLLPGQTFNQGVTP